MSSKPRAVTRDPTVFVFDDDAARDEIRKHFEQREREEDFEFTEDQIEYELAERRTAAMQTHEQMLRRKQQQQQQQQTNKPAAPAATVAKQPVVFKIPAVKKPKAATVNPAPDKSVAAPAAVAKTAATITPIAAHDVRCTVPCFKLAYNDPRSKEPRLDWFQHYQQEVKRLSVHLHATPEAMMQDLDRRVLSYLQSERWRGQALFVDKCPPAMQGTRLSDEYGPEGPKAHTPMIIPDIALDLERFTRPLQHATLDLNLVSADEVYTINTLPRLDPEACQYEKLAAKYSLQEMEALLRMHVPWTGQEALYQAVMVHKRAPDAVYALTSFTPLGEVLCNHMIYDQLADGWDGPSQELMHQDPENRNKAWLVNKSFLECSVGREKSVEVHWERQRLLAQVYSLSLPSLQSLYESDGYEDAWHFVFPRLGKAESYPDGTRGRRALEAMFPSPDAMWFFLQQHLVVLNSCLSHLLLNKYRDLLFEKPVLNRETRLARLGCSEHDVQLVLGGYLQFRYYGARIWTQLAAGFASYLVQPSCANVLYQGLRLATNGHEYRSIEVLRNTDKTISLAAQILQQLRASVVLPLARDHAGTAWYADSSLYAIAMLHAYQAQCLRRQEQESAAPELDHDSVIETPCLEALMLCNRLTPQVLMLKPRSDRVVSCETQLVTGHFVPVAAPLRTYVRALDEYASSMTRGSQTACHPGTLYTRCWEAAIQWEVEAPTAMNPALGLHVTLRGGRTHMSNLIRTQWLTQVITLERGQPGYSKGELLWFIVRWVNLQVPSKHQMSLKPAAMVRLRSFLRPSSGVAEYTHARYATRAGSALDTWIKSLSPEACVIPEQLIQRLTRTAPLLAVPQVVRAPPLPSPVNTPRELNAEERARLKMERKMERQAERRINKRMKKDLVTLEQKAEKRKKYNAGVQMKRRSNRQHQTEEEYANTDDEEKEHGQRRPLPTQAEEEEED